MTEPDSQTQARARKHACIHGTCTMMAFPILLRTVDITPMLSPRGHHTVNNMARLAALQMRNLFSKDRNSSPELSMANVALQAPTGWVAGNVTKAQYSVASNSAQM